ncbi:MAG TPA: tetratricopeptide repeat protein [Niabella sp.]|nr:tetratricopeptide repeat protein [Niabella sp.]HRB75970.1 tetratricopeptide repeat protein [Niabella sp.]HRC10929.1 tetratricopeptide repeat protein [Niabella sp.]
MNYCRRTTILFRTIFFFLLVFSSFIVVAQNKPKYPFSVMPDSKAKVDSILSWNERNRSDPNRHAIYKELFRMVENLDYKDATPALYNSYGVFLRDISLYDSSIGWHLKALDVAKLQNNTHEQIISYNNLGVAYRRMDDYVLALDYLDLSRDLSEKSGDNFSLTVALNSIGNIHLMQREYKTAIEYFMECIPISIKAGNDRGLAINMQNLGECYQKLGQSDSAEHYYTQALDYNKKRNDNKGIAICYNSIGNLLQEKGEIAKALNLYKLALPINIKLRDKIFIANSYNNIAEAYLLRKDYQLAKQMFDTSLKISSTIGSVAEAKEAYEGLMKIAEAEQSWQKAFTYSKLFKSLSDSIVNSQTTQTLRGKELAYHQGKIALLESKGKNDRILIFGGLMLFLLLAISGVLYYLRNRLLERSNRLQQELEIRTQIASDLHDDMGSSLSSIHIFSELLRKKGLDSNELLSKIEANAKDTLEALDDIIWLVKPSNDKFSNLGTHIREFSVPLFESKEINFEIEFPDSISEIPLPMETRRNIYLIIKESVNNLIKYSECTSASIKATYEGGDLVFTVKDNGKGFDPDMITDRNGVKNLRARAKKIDAEIQFNSALGKGTEIVLITNVKNSSNT